MAFSTQYPVNFSTMKTSEIIKRGCIDEIAEVYNGLNDVELIASPSTILDQTVNTTTVPEDTLPGLFIIERPPSDTDTYRVLLCDSRTPAPGEAEFVEVFLEDVTADTIPYRTARTEELVTEKQLAETLAGIPPMIPTGGICIWRGAVDTVPPGWFLCDGENGTPDLRALFVRGQAPGMNSPDSGADSFNLPAQSLPTHTHTMTVSAQDTAHTHSVYVVTAQRTVNHNHGSGMLVTSSKADGAHNHFFDGYDSLVVSGDPLQMYTAGRHAPVTVLSTDSWGVIAQSVGPHTHSISFGDPDPLIGGSLGEHTHSIAVSDSFDGGGGTTFSGNTGVTGVAATLALDNRPTFQDVVYIMRGDIDAA